jgi:hypothetical protein
MEPREEGVNGMRDEERMECKEKGLNRIVRVKIEWNEKRKDQVEREEEGLTCMRRKRI